MKKNIDEVLQAVCVMGASIIALWWFAFLG